MTLTAEEQRDTRAGPCHGAASASKDDDDTDDEDTNASVYLLLRAGGTNAFPPRRRGLRSVAGPRHEYRAN